MPFTARPSSTVAHAAALPRPGRAATPARLRAAKLYMASTVVVAAVALAALSVAGDKPLLGSAPAITAVLAACAVISESRPLRWLRSTSPTEVTVSWTFLFALVLVSPRVTAMALAVLACALGDLSLRKSLLKVAFNAGQSGLAVGLAGLTFNLGGGMDLAVHRSLTVGQLGLLALAGVVALATNNVLTYAAVSLSTGRSLVSLLAEEGPRNLSADGLLLLLSPIFVVAAEANPALVVPLALVTVAVCRAQSRAASSSHDADHDPVTDLPNRRLLRTHLDTLVSQAAGRDVALRVAIIDLDHFKDVNDRFGHHTGDLVLQELAARLVADGGPGELVARMGGDEFAVVTPWVAGDDDGAGLAERIRLIFDRPFDGGGLPVDVDASVGVATYPFDALDASDLLRVADQSMYADKRAGRPPVPVPGRVPTRAEPRGERDVHGPDRIRLLTDLGRAIGGPQMRLDYQPMVELADGRLVGAEALLRWDRPRHGPVSPALFMPLAEHTALIRPLTEWVLGEALAQAARWAGDGVTVPLSVNVSTRNLVDESFAPMVATLLAGADLPAGALTLEVTENALALDLDRVRRCLHQLRDVGVTLSMDDFGTGYSSMAQLRDLPVDVLKIDRRFVAAVGHERRGAAMVEAMIRLAEALDMTAVAEGIEDEATRKVLLDLGCRRGQGYLFGRPVRPDLLLATATAAAR